MTRSIGPIALALLLTTRLAFAHGDAVPQAVDTAGLPDLPEEMATENPWRNAQGDLMFDAVEVGAKGFNSNCARCHGLEAVSGGLAPDLRYLEASDYGDEWYLTRIQNGYEQNGAVKMPPFKDILSQEAIWAIRTYIETRPDADELAAHADELAALRDKVSAVDGPEEAAQVADELDAAGGQFEALSGAPASVTVLHQAAHVLRTRPTHTAAAAEMISGVLRN
ncbi:cytochrome c-550 PedF [Paenirhodobacter sp.]|uniref:cytochrome c-550 PedF n=1 Tax=Paenirhodobacter sp. TaxID=1965326 RepID=UPI003B3E4544